MIDGEPAGTEGTASPGDLFEPQGLAEPNLAELSAYQVPEMSYQELLFSVLELGIDPAEDSPWHADVRGVLGTQVRARYDKGIHNAGIIARDIFGALFDGQRIPDRPYHLVIDAVKTIRGVP